MSEHDEQRGRPADDALSQRAARLFDDSVQGLDGETRSRLNQVRQQALAAPAGRDLFRFAWIPIGATAAVAMIAVAMWNGREQSPGLPELTAPTFATDFEILLDQDELEMLEELEFYSWIDLDEALHDADPDRHVG